MLHHWSEYQWIFHPRWSVDWKWWRHFRLHVNISFQWFHASNHQCLICLSLSLCGWSFFMLTPYLGIFFRTVKCSVNSLSAKFSRTANQVNEISPYIREMLLMRKGSRWPNFNEIITKYGLFFRTEQQKSQNLTPYLGIFFRTAKCSVNSLSSKFSRTANQVNEISPYIRENT